MTACAKILEQLKILQKEGFDFADSWGDLVKYLQESEQQVIELIEYLQGNIPKYTPKGDIDFGLVLHWLEYPPPDIQRILNGTSDIDKTFAFIWNAIAAAAPKSKITQAQYAFLECEIQKQGGVPGPDGTLFGYGKYEQMDTGWAWAVVNFGLNEIFGARTSFGGSPYNQPISNVDKDTVRIAIIGDWGTGTWDDYGTQGPAVEIMAQVKSKNPTHVIHLGDVYYAGTDLRPPPDEE
ncbi:MAG: metallophosphoesterase, partial [Desulfovibrionales bacterium]|nr:metallophosphoesterase [Desulfovibrionales bacterium]